jgi:hypothetical protein
MKGIERTGERWTVAEDLRLLELMRAALVQTRRSVFSYGPGTPASLVATTLHRTPAAVMARYQALRVAEAHRVADAARDRSGFGGMGDGAGI